MSITYFDPDEGEGDDTTVDATTSGPARRWTAGGKLVAGGLAGYLAIQLWQVARFDFSDPWLNVLLGVGFLLTSAVLSAGVVVIVLRRWVLPELAREVATAVVRETAGQNDGEQPTRDR